MKTLLISSLMLLSLNSFASDVVNDAVERVERGEELTCTPTKSTMNICLGYICTNKEVFTCTDGQITKTLTLRVKKVKYPGEEAKVSIVSKKLE